MKRLLRLLIATSVAVGSFLAMSVFVAPYAEAGPSGSSCSLTVKGCTKYRAHLADTYQFNVSDANLSNNYYFGESCGLPGHCELPVLNNVGAYKKNQAATTRFCRYSGFNYTNTVGWVTQTNVWASTAAPHTAGSLQFRNANTC